MPYGGATTTCEALSMGVPVITMAGSGMVGRLSASILESGNLKENICYTKEDYIRIASRAAKKGIRRKEKELNLSKDLEKAIYSILKG